MRKNNGPWFDLSDHDTVVQINITAASSVERKGNIGRVFDFLKILQVCKILRVGDNPTRKRRSIAETIFGEPQIGS